MGCCFTSNKVHNFGELKEQITQVKEPSKAASFHWGYEGDVGIRQAFI